VFTAILGNGIKFDGVTENRYVSKEEGNEQFLDNFSQKVKLR
jgi:hypothetical protein